MVRPAFRAPSQGRAGMQNGFGAPAPLTTGAMMHVQGERLLVKRTLNCLGVMPGLDPGIHRPRSGQTKTAALLFRWIAGQARQ